MHQIGIFYASALSSIIADIQVFIPFKIKRYSFQLKLISVLQLFLCVKCKIII